MSGRPRKAPHPRQAERRRIRHCQDCRKRSHRSRKAAATAAAMSRGIRREVVNYYRCPAGNGWHIGHTPRSAGRAEVEARMRRAGIKPAGTYRGRPIR